MQTLDYRHPQSPTPRRRKKRHLLPPGIGPGLNSLFAGLLPVFGFCALILFALILPRDGRYALGMFLIPLFPFVGGFFVICAAILHGRIAVQLRRELEERHAIPFDRFVAWCMWSTGVTLLLATVLFVIAH